MSQQPKISIILPTYNRAGLIEETIRSIQNQTYTNWELIVIDDGSEDNTKEIIEKQNDGRIVFVQNERTGIVGKLKNRALNQASGAFVAFIDSDDLWHESKLEKQLTALMEHPDAGFCLVNGYNFRQLGKAVNYFYTRTSGSSEGNFFQQCFQSKVAGYTQALLFRKDCIPVSGYFKEDKPFTDFEFIISLTLHFKGIILYEPLVYRRIHQNNFSHSTWLNSMNEGIQIIRNYQHQLPLKIVKESLFRLHIDFGEKYLKQKERWKAVQHFSKAWMNKPLTIVPAKKMAKTIVSLFRQV